MLLLTEPNAKKARSSSDQRAIAARLTFTFARDALPDQTSGVDQGAIGLIDGGNKRRVADPFRLAHFANELFI